MSKTCVWGSEDCKNIKCAQQCATCNLVPDKITDIKAKIQSCETLLASLEKSDPQALESLQQKKRVLDAQIVQIERSTQVKALSTQPAIKTTTDMIKEMKAENDKMKAAVEQLSTQLVALKSQLMNSTKTFDENQARLEAAKECFAAIKEIEEKRILLSQMKTEMKSVKANLDALVAEEQRTSGLPIDFNDEKCQTRYRLAVEKHNLALNERDNLKNKLRAIQSQFITKGNQPFVVKDGYYCDGAKINYLQELKNFYGVVLKTPTKTDSRLDGYKNGQETCQSWQGINTKEEQDAVLGVPDEFHVYPGENCWNSIIKRCVNLNNNTPNPAIPMPEGISSLANRLNLTSEEKALISERISLGKEAFMKKYNLTQAVASNENCPDGWTQMSDKCVVPVDHANAPKNSNCKKDNDKEQIGGKTYIVARFGDYSKDQKRNWAADVCKVLWRAVGVSNLST